ncbi:MAG: hypothetical protein M3Q46_04800 [Verrucomicrobiota bacterium]|nr:hypothetical protein [Verrucomicrobiota bacterium]
MEPDLFRFDDHRGFERKRTNYFAWTVVILLLTGGALAAWLGSFYVIGQPERPESYRLLKKLHKIEAPKRFALTAAPSGEFLNPRQLYQRYQSMGPAELARKDAELTRNFIRNFQQVHGLVTYVVGRFNIMGARELTPDDVFTSGAVALARAAAQPELLMEHVFTTADAHDAKLLQERLVMGMDVNFERSHDLSAVIHIERLPDGRIQITAVPLLYGSYAMTRGTGTFSLEPPDDLNLAAGWPIFKAENRRTVENRYEGYRSRLAPATSTLPIVGLPPAKTAAPPEDALVRVEAAVPLDDEPRPPPSRRGSLSRVAAKVNEKTPPVAVASKAAVPVRRAQPVGPGDEATPNESPAVAAASPANTPTVLRALPVTESSPAVALTSTTGASWKTFAPGAAPSGKVLDSAGLREMANSGTRGERVYLKGQFVVNFADANRAVLRPTSGQAAQGRGGLARNLRVIVDYPAGAPLPEPGSTLDRDESRPYEITEVRRQSDGQLNVFVREIIKP